MRSWCPLLPPGILLLALTAAAAPPHADADDPLPAGAVARLGTARFRIGEPIVAADLSPDGKLIAVTGHEEDVRLLDAASGRVVRRLRKEDTNATGLAFSPDGKTLAVVESEQTVQLWDTATGRAGHNLSVPEGRVGNPVFSADGRLVAAGSDATPAKTPLPVWDTVSGKLVASLAVVHNQPRRVALSADGKLIAVCGQFEEGVRPKGKPDEAGRSVHVWDVAKNKEVRRLTADYGDVSNVAFAPDGKTLAAACGSSTLVFWDVATGQELRRCAARRGAVPFLAYSPDGKYLAAVTENGAAQLWDAATGRRLGQYEVPPETPLRVRFTREGRALACGNTEKAVFLYDLLSRKLLTPALGHADAVQGLAFRAGGKELMSASPDGEVIAWDAAAGRELRRVRLRPDPDLFDMRSPGNMGRVILSPDGRHVLVTGFGEEYLYEAATGDPVLSPEGSEAGTPAAAFAPDGSRFAVTTLGGTPAVPRAAVRVYDVGTGRRLRVLGEGHAAGALVFGPDGKLLVAVLQGRGAAPAELHAWDLTTGKERWQANLAPGIVPALAVSPDGKVLASGDDDSGTVTLREAPTGRELRAIAAAKGGGVGRLRFSPDGQLLAVAYTPQGHKPPRLRVWELATGTARFDFSGPDGEIAALCFSPDGRRLASGGADTTVLLWDLTGRAGEGAPKDRPGPEELEKLWAALSDPEARAAHRAMARLEAAPDEAVALLAKHVKPAEAPAVDADRIDRLIAALNADGFEERERAGKELAALGRAAEAPLRKALAGNPPAEVKRRIEELLDRLRDNGAPPPELLRPLRAVELLEHLGTPQARKLLEALAKGAADSPLTEAAQGALARLGRAGKP